MDSFNHALDVELTDILDQLLTLNVWARVHQRLAIDISEDQFEQQLLKLRLVELRPPAHSTAFLQSDVNTHWIAARLLSALAWQRRQLSDSADELSETLKACAFYAQTDRAIYYYQKMCELCNELCLSASKACILEKKIAMQLYKLGVEGAVHYLPNRHYTLH